MELLAITEHDPTTLVRAMSIADPGRAGAREEIARESERGGWRIAAGEMIVNETLGIACLEVAAGVRVRTHNGSSDRD